MRPDLIAIIYHDSDNKLPAAKLSEQLQLPLLAAGQATQKYQLAYCNDRLQLHISESNYNPIYIDFLNGKLAHRARFGGGKSQLLARACGLHRQKNPVILDCTAGLAEDGFVLASLGASVTLLERSPIIAALIADALQRGQENETVQRLQLTHTDAIDFLKNESSTHYDVVYIDTMFPERQKSAAVKKEMRVLKELVGTDDDANDLLQAALASSIKKVVVKRPKLAGAIGGIKPTHVLQGESSRFDVYC